MASWRISPRASRRPQRHRSGAWPVCVSAVLKSHSSFEMSLEGPGSLDNWQTSFTFGADIKDRAMHCVPAPLKHHPRPRGVAQGGPQPLSVWCCLISFLFSLFLFFHPLLLASTQLDTGRAFSCELWGSSWKAE